MSLQFGARLLQFLHSCAEASRLGSRRLSRLNRRSDIGLMIGGQLVDDLLQLGAPLGIDLLAIDCRRR